jgi:hypothetical protein
VDAVTARRPSDGRGRRGAHVLLASLWLATAALGPAFATAPPPGSVLALEARAELGTATIDATVGGRFRADGEVAPRARTGVTHYLLRFATTGPDGGPAAASAQLFVPHDVSDDALLAFAPGSTGLDTDCGPTALWLATGQVESYGATALAYAGQGLPTVLPDYLAGTGSGGLQPYFVATAEATVVLDALRAARQALHGVAPHVAVAHAFVGGYSQGGHAAFAAADRAAVYADDLPLAGVVGFGPSSDLDTLFLHFPHTAPWVVRAYAEVYPGRLDAADVLVEPFLSRLDDDVRRMCVLGAQASYPEDPANLYTASFHEALQAGTLARDFPAWREAFDRNDVGLRLDGLPVAVFQGVDDPIVPLAAQDRFVTRLCEADSPVRYANYLRTRHETRYIGFADALAWMRAVAAGAPPPNDCTEVLTP